MRARGSGARRGGEGDFASRYFRQIGAPRIRFAKETTALLGDLPLGAADVLRLRFGLGDDFARTLKEVGDKFGLSRERIRQIEAAALRRLHGRPQVKRAKAWIEG